MVLDMVGFAKVKEDGFMEKMLDTKIKKERILKTKFSFLFVFNALFVMIAKRSK
jgi:hypothetical protein